MWKSGSSLIQKLSNQHKSNFNLKLPHPLIKSYLTSISVYCPLIFLTEIVKIFFFLSLPFSLKFFLVTHVKSTTIFGFRIKRKIIKKLQHRPCVFVVRFLALLWFVKISIFCSGSRIFKSKLTFQQVALKFFKWHSATTDRPMEKNMKRALNRVSCSMYVRSIFVESARKQKNKNKSNEIPLTAPQKK